MASELKSPVSLGEGPLADEFVPVIDLSNSRTGAGRQEVAEKIGHACATSGFLVVVGHGIDPQVVKGMYDTTREFFHLPIEEKEHVRLSEGTVGYSRVGGYVAASIGVETAPDLCELFNMNRFGEPGVAEGVNLGTEWAKLTVPNPWPQRPSQFREMWLNYYQAMEHLAAELMRLFALALGLSESFFDDKIDQHMTGLTANFYYPPSRAALPNQFRKGPHTDWGSLTILFQDDAGGLQVEHPSLGWRNVPYVPESFVINLGDLMAEWTSGRWVSTMHRVLPAPYPETVRDRVSIAFFHQPNYDAVIEPLWGPPPGSAARSEPVTSGAWIAEKMAAAYGR